MLNFGKRKKIVINNDQAEKAMVTNYYIENDFCKARSIDHNLDCFIV